MSPPPLHLWPPGDWPLLARLLVPAAISVSLLLLLWRILSYGIFSDSLVRNGDIVGQVGVLLLSCGPRQRGLVRLTVKGNLMDLPARTDGRTLDVNQTVMVLQQRHDHVLVMPLQQVFSTNLQKLQAND
jgi:membrane protein implicated in regulation of membrane protease activity